MDNSESDAPKIAKPSRWIGLICIALFFLLGCYSGCPWFMWIVFGILGILTLTGTSRLTQGILGVALVLLTFPLEDKDAMSSSSSSSNYQQYDPSSSKKQTESEKKEIEKLFKQLEILKTQFDSADKKGYPMSELKRISDEAWRVKTKLEDMNLTKEQRVKLSNMF